MLVSTSIISHNYDFFFVVRVFNIYSPSNFQVYNTVLLTLVTTLYIRSPELTHLITGSLHLLFTFIHFAHPQTPPLATTNQFSMSSFPFFFWLCYIACKILVP